MTDKFNFISDDNFRRVLTRDFAELQNANNSGAWKSSVVLAGSIVEAVLAEHLIEIGYGKPTGINPLEMTLGELLNTCKKEQAIARRTASLAEAIRDYRNLIHPGKEIRTKDVPTKELANLTLSLVEIILAEISEKREKRRGLTASQFISKIESDTSAADVVSHLISRMTRQEVDKLLDGPIVERFFDLQDIKTTLSWPEDWEVEEQQKGLAKSYMEILCAVSEEKRRLTLARTIKVIQESSEEYVRLYLSSFFSAEFLPYFTKEDQRFIIDYLHKMIDKRVDEEMLSCCKRIFQYLRADGEVPKFIDSFLRAFAKDGDEAFVEKVKEFLRDEGEKLTGKLEEQFIRAECD